MTLPDELLKLAESWRSRALRSADRREVAAYRFCASQLERALRDATVSDTPPAAPDTPPQSRQK